MIKIRWWSKFIELGTVEAIERNRKALVLYTMSYIGSAVMFCFSYFTYGQEQKLFYTLFISACIIFINVILSHCLIKLQTANYIACFAIFILLSGLAYTGGYQNTGLFWMFPFPIVFFILLNYRIGLFANIILLSVIFTIINNPNLNIANYEALSNLRFEVAIVLTTLFAFLSEFTRSQSHQDLMKLNKEKQRLAHTDQLTNLPNRHYLAQLDLSGDNNPANSANFPLAVVMADIDFFKTVNDRFGHDVGDDVLRHLAGFLKNNIRSSDIVIRMGGEEFLMLFPATSIEMATIICNKLNSHLRNAPFHHDNEEIVITLSFGIALARSSIAIEGASKAADELLYQAKKNGRGRAETVVCSND